MLLEPPSLLITDDDPGFRETLRFVFEPKGFRTLLASDGEEALKIVHTETVHVVLLDVHMPKLTGLETLRMMKEFRAMLPCILLSAQLDELILEQARLAHAYLVLSKTVTVGQITGAVRQARAAYLCMARMTMAKVLVTGASGFIGTHLVAALAGRGEEITCFVRKTSKVDRLQALGVRLVYGDVTDPRKSAGGGGRPPNRLPSGRLHAGAAPRQFFEVNCRGVAHVARACAAQDRPPVLIHVSSQAAAGPAVEGRPRVESDPASPVSQYGRTKRLGECAAESLAHRVPITIVRPPMVLGEGDRLGLSLFRSVVRFHVHLTPGIGPQRFSLIHADDLVQLLILAAERGRRLPPEGRAEPPGLPGLLLRRLRARPDLRRPGPPGGRVGGPAGAGDSDGHARGADAGGDGGNGLPRPAQPAGHQPGQGPRNCRRLLALFGPNGPRRAGFRRRRPADRAAAANDRMVLS